MVELARRGSVRLPNLNCMTSPVCLFRFLCAKWKLECVCIAARCTTRKVYYDGMTECDFCVVMSEVLLPVKCIML